MPKPVGSRLGEPRSRPSSSTRHNTNHRFSHSLSKALKAAGWVWAPARLDPLVVSLDAIASVIPVAPPPALSPNLLSWSASVNLVRGWTRD